MARLPAEEPAHTKNKAKNAREAHECIRPTVGQSPDKVRLEPDRAQLYDLIWKRALASQMEAARRGAPRSMWRAPTRTVGLRATGQVVTDGSSGGRDDGNSSSSTRRMGCLPVIVAGEPAEKRSVTPEQHFTPAAAALYRGDARQADGGARDQAPSTYASIVSTIQKATMCARKRTACTRRTRGGW